MIGIDSKIHPFLPRSFKDKRSRLIVEQAEAALRFELTDERIEEREYDEQQHMRVCRTINRLVIRGEAYERYTALAAGLGEGAGDALDLESKVRAQLDSDLKLISAGENVRNDLGGSLRRYAEMVPPEKWPAVLCIANNPGAADKIRNHIVSLGFLLLPSGLLERFGIMKFACPPEMSFVREMADLPEICFIADAGTPVRAPEPMATTTMMAESRQILGVTPDMTEHFGQDVTLAVLDTGLDRSHPAFANIAKEDYRNFTSSSDEDVEGHGTHVASIAAGHDTTLECKYSGIAPRCRLIAGKVISGERTGGLESVLHGMAWAVFERRADILSLSLGDPETPPNGLSIWTRACDEAFRQGTVVCVAAGNPEPPYPGSISVPGDSTTAITVGAIDKHRHLASFSAQGSPTSQSPLYGKPNCVGPGVDIVAARSSSAAFAPSELVDSLHVRLSGTSMAAPAIAGCLVLIKSKARSLGLEMTPEELREVLYQVCRPLAKETGENYRNDIEVGHGLLDMKEAFRKVEALAKTRTPIQAEAAGQSAPDTPHAPEASGVVRPRPLPAEREGFQADVCYHCGKRYLGRVGTFSPAWKCHECGAPVCVVCWQTGIRECEQHYGSKIPVGVGPVDQSGKAIEQTTPGPGTHPADIGPYMNPESVRTRIAPMRSSETSSQNPSARPDPHWGDTFLNRFDWNVRNLRYLTHPLIDEEYKVDPKAGIQLFRRAFGQVAQLPLAAGLLKRVRFILSAIRLDESGLTAVGDSQRPAQNILQQVSGPAGLDFQDDVFYCVGIFSPVGWPEEWRSHAELRGNAIFYLVEKGEGTCWRVFGPQGPLLNLFDPESHDEKKVRAAKTLANHTKLVLPGDQIAMDSFLDEQHLDRSAIENAIQASEGRYRILEHKGKSYIQRSIR